MFEGILTEERDYLISASESAMRALMRCQAVHLFAKHADGAAVAPQIARDEIEECGLASAVGADDEPSLACFYFERDAVRGRQAAERFLEGSNFESRSHCDRQRAHKRFTPGTSPSGMKITMTTNTKPSSMFQRSM